MKRCIDCKGKGHMPLSKEDAQKKLELIIQGLSYMRNDGFVGICPICKGRGFLNPIFRSDKHFNISKRSSRRSRQTNRQNL